MAINGQRIHLLVAGSKVSNVKLTFHGEYGELRAINGQRMHLLIARLNVIYSRAHCLHISQ